MIGGNENVLDRDDVLVRAVRENHFPDNVS